VAAGNLDEQVPVDTRDELGRLSRAFNEMTARLREAAKLGFKRAIVPQRLGKGEPWPADIKVLEARTLRQALEQALIPGGK